MEKLKKNKRNRTRVVLKARKRKGGKGKILKMF